MKKIIWTILAVLVMALLAACGSSGNNDIEQGTGNEEEEIKELKVNFEVPETAEVISANEMYHL